MVIPGALALSEAGSVRRHRVRTTTPTPPPWPCGGPCRRCCGPGATPTGPKQNVALGTAVLRATRAERGISAARTPTTILSVDNWRVNPRRGLQASGRLVGCVSGGDRGGQDRRQRRQVDRRAFARGRTGRRGNSGFVDRAWTRLRPPDRLAQPRREGRGDDGPSPRHRTRFAPYVPPLPATTSIGPVEPPVWVDASLVLHAKTVRESVRQCAPVSSGFQRTPADERRPRKRRNPALPYRITPGEANRGGRTRTCNPRFWRAVAYP